MAAVTNAPGDSMLVVTNGLAGRTEEEAVREVVAELGGEPNVEVVTCHRESDLDGLLDRRAGRTLVVVGGDGSLHTVLKHLWRRGEVADCPVGLIPLGTGNDFARGVGIPLDHRAAAGLIRTGQPSRSARSPPASPSRATGSAWRWTARSSRAAGARC